MPAYNYRCIKCRKVFEVTKVQYDDRTNRSCEYCDGEGERLLSAPKVFEKARHDGAKLDDNYRRYVAETEEKISKQDNVDVFSDVDY